MSSVEQTVHVANAFPVESTPSPAGKTQARGKRSALGDASGSKGPPPKRGRPIKASCAEDEAPLVKPVVKCAQKSAVAKAKTKAKAKAKAAKQAEPDETETVDQKAAAAKKGGQKAKKQTAGDKDKADQKKVVPEKRPRRSSNHTSGSQASASTAPSLDDDKQLMDEMFKDLDLGALGHGNDIFSGEPPIHGDDGDEEATDGPDVGPAQVTFLLEGCGTKINDQKPWGKANQRRLRQGGARFENSGARFSSYGVKR